MKFSHSDNVIIGWAIGDDTYADRKLEEHRKKKLGLMHEYEKRPMPYYISPTWMKKHETR